MTYRKKLIEVSLPLEAINTESAREKSIRYGHPSTLHLWWARRPLAACRAVLWSSLVDDPSEYMPDEKSANRERERLFAILEELVKWENINNETVLDAAKLEITRSVARDLNCEVPVGKQAINDFLATKAPPVLDPFAGGGSIPLEAQRLGLRAYASDLNPVAVLINKALIEIPPKFAGMPPIHPPEKGQGQASLLQREWKGAEGLAEDVRYYGKWIRDKADNRIGHLYPKAKITAEILAERHDLRAQGLKAGDELTVIAWLWARTVICPNPACNAQMPLARSFDLSAKKGKEAHIEPLVEGSQINFYIKTGKGKAHDGTVDRNGAKCICCGTPVPFDYIRSEGRAGRMGTRLMAVVVEGKGSRSFLSPNPKYEEIASSAIPHWEPDTDLPEKALGFRVQSYGMKKHADLFTSRQLLALTTFSDLVNEAQNQIISDTGKVDYAQAVGVYLSFGISRMASSNNTLCRWTVNKTQVIPIFARQAIPMVWDFAENNVFNDAAGDITVALDNIARVIEKSSQNVKGIAIQHDAQSDYGFHDIIVSTDPPYYDNIGYADLSDFFYVWLRQILKDSFPDLFRTMLVPKAEELVATPYRFNGKAEEARKFYENGMLQTFRQINANANDEIPITVYYAYKQSESDEDDEGTTQNASTGWETMLSAVIQAGFSITGTWPMRTELFNRMVGADTNALASSIVLVCRKRLSSAPICVRREFFSALKRDLPLALHLLQLGSIAPVDLAQAAIGPGMAIFSRYKSVLEADGSNMTVRSALALINQELDEYLAEQEGEYDADTRWALAWFEQYGNEQGPYGVAETLSKAKNTSVEGLSHAGFLEARAGKVRLLRRDELDKEWDPAKDLRLTAWEAVQYLIRTLDKEGEKGAGALLGKLGAIGETARDLAYRLYTICERKGWAQEALAYNMLVVAWPRIKEQAGKGVRQDRML